MSRSDQSVLSNDSGFKGRVTASLQAACVSIQAETITDIFLHVARGRYASNVLNNPSAFTALFSGTVATDASVIADATVNGTVALTTANVATQSALVTDAHIDAAVAGQFNAF